MTDDPIPFHRPSIGDAERAAVLRVLDSGWLTTGVEAAAFEREFAALVGSPAAVAVSSCTAALHLACVLAGWTYPKCRVAVPTLTFTATAAAVAQAGATPVLLDVDPETLNMSRDEFLDGLYGGLHGAVFVHYGGNPSGFRELAKAAASWKVQVVVDAAHAFPASFPDWGGKMHTVGGAYPGVGATCFSFYPTKPATTAEGGMLALADPRLEGRARRLTLHGVSADAYQRSRAGLYHYAVTEEGWKYNLPDLLAALGRAQLARATALAHDRRTIAWRYAAQLKVAADAGLLRLPTVDGECSSAWHLYPVRLNVGRLRGDAGAARDRVAERLRGRGVATSLHYRPLHRHPYWRAFVRPGQAFPVADAAYAELLSLPIWPGMTEGQVERVASTLLEVLEEMTP